MFSTRRRAIEHLLADLDALSDNAHARAFARRVRDGEVEECLGEVAARVAECSTLGRTTSVCGAFVAYDAALSGVSILAGPNDLARARAAAAAPAISLQRALQRRDRAREAAENRRNARTLAALRAAARERL